MNIMHTLIGKIGTLCLLVVGLLSCEKGGISSQEAKERNLFEHLATMNRFKMYLAAVEKAGLKDKLTGTEPITAFVLSDSAFAAAGINVNTTSPEMLKNILQYHFIPGAKRLEDIPQGYVTTIDNRRIWLKRDLNSITKFATKLDVNERRVTKFFAGFPQTNLIASNGFFNELDYVLTPPTQTVLQIVETTKELDSLNKYLTLAGVKNTVATNGPITFFAPNNAAIFSARLWELSPADLIDKLKMHIANPLIPGVTVPTPDLLYAKDITNNLNIPTLKTGVSLTASVSGGVIKLNNNSTVVVADKNGTNGVVHIIDKVL